MTAFWEPAGYPQSPVQRATSAQLKAPPLHVTVTPADPDCRPEERSELYCILEVLGCGSTFLIS